MNELINSFLEWGKGAGLLGSVFAIWKLRAIWIEFRKTMVSRVDVEKMILRAKAADITDQVNMLSKYIEAAEADAPYTPVMKGNREVLIEQQKKIQERFKELD